MFTQVQTRNVNVPISLRFCDYLCIIDTVEIINFSNFLFQRTKRFTFVPMMIFLLPSCGHVNFIRRVRWSLWSGSRTLKKRIRFCCKIWCQAMKKRVSRSTTSLTYWIPTIIKIVEYCWWTVENYGIRLKWHVINFSACFISFI